MSLSKLPPVSFLLHHNRQGFESQPMWCGSSAFSPLLSSQELVKAEQASEQFSFKLNVQEAKGVAAQAATTVSEAFIINLILDTSVASDSKKRKLEKEFKQMESHSLAFGVQIGDLAHPRVLGEATDFLLSSKRT